MKNNINLARKSSSVLLRLFNSNNNNKIMMAKNCRMNNLNRNLVTLVNNSNNNNSNNNNKYSHLNYNHSNNMLLYRYFSVSFQTIGMPSLSPTMTHGTIASWQKKPGNDNTLK